MGQICQNSVLFSDKACCQPIRARSLFGNLIIKVNNYNQLKAGVNLKLCKKNSKSCLYRNFNLKVLKSYFENFCYCKSKARLPKTSYFCLWEKILVQ